MIFSKLHKVDVARCNSEATDCIDVILYKSFDLDTCKINPSYLR